MAGWGRVGRPWGQGFLLGCAAHPWPGIPGRATVVCAGEGVRALGPAEGWEGDKRPTGQWVPSRRECEGG